MSYSSVICVKVTPSGFEPKSSEPESEILSIELWGHSVLVCKSNYILGYFAIMQSLQVFMLTFLLSCKKLVGVFTKQWNPENSLAI